MMSEFEKQVRHALIDRDMTMTDLANELGITISYVSDLLKGKRTNRVFVSYVLLRKQTCKDMKKKMVKIRKKVESGNMMNYSEWCSINSYKGWTDYGNCFRLTQKYVEPLIPYATKYYELNVKKGGKVA